MRLFGVHVNVAIVVVAAIVLVGWVATTAPLALMLIAAILVLACPLVMFWLLRYLRIVPEAGSDAGAGSRERYGSRQMVDKGTGDGEGYPLMQRERR